MLPGASPAYQPLVCHPPSTNNVWPVTKSEAGLARKMAAPTISEGWANRPSLIRPSKRFARAGFRCMFRSVFSLSVVVGAMALMRMPTGPHSVARAAVMYDTAAFASPYMLLPVSVLADQVELILMIFP